MQTQPSPFIESSFKAARMKGNANYLAVFTTGFYLLTVFEAV